MLRFVKIFVHLATGETRGRRRRGAPQGAENARGPISKVLAQGTHQFGRSKANKNTRQHVCCMFAYVHELAHFKLKHNTNARRMVVFFRGAMPMFPDRLARSWWLFD